MGKIERQKQPASPPREQQPPRGFAIECYLSRPASSALIMPDPPEGPPDQLIDIG